MPTENNPSENPIQEFSFYIHKASLDKATQTMRWYATASDIDADSYNDNMTLELYEDFLSRIESKELPPERHRSEYWAGGIPYISISHYLDLGGKGVPGEIETIYVDGKCLKAKGTFSNTVLGKRCFDAVCEDLYSEKKSDQDNKVRISIAFIDWAHRHKSTGETFVRESLSDMCGECLKEAITGKSEGKEFLKGHLIHLALTRVPVNERTNMEVERSMVTQLEDAASIVGEDQAEELEELASEVGKADLVIKSETEEEPVVEEAKVKKEEDDEEEMDDKKKKKGEDEEKSDVVVEPHVLEPIFDDLRASYDEIVAKGGTVEEVLIQLQEPFTVFGEALKSTVETPEYTQETQERALLDEIKSMISPVQESLAALAQEVSILKQQSLTHQTPVPEQEQTIRRSFQFQNPMSLLEPAPSGKPLSIDEIARRSVTGR